MSVFIVLISLHFIISFPKNWRYFSLAYIMFCSISPPSPDINIICPKIQRQSLVVWNLGSSNMCFLVCCRHIQNFINCHNRSISTPSSRDSKYHNVWTKGELLDFVVMIASQSRVDFIDAFT